MSIFELWLFTTAIPGLAFLGWAVFLICSFALGIFLIVGAVTQLEDDDISSKCYAISRKLLVTIIISGFTGALLPGTHEMLLIAGGYTSTNSQEIAKLPTSAAKAANAWLDAVTKEAEKQNKTN